MYKNELNNYHKLNAFIYIFFSLINNTIPKQQNNTTTTRKTKKKNENHLNTIFLKTEILCKKTNK